MREAGRALPLLCSLKQTQNQTQVGSVQGVECVELLWVELQCNGGLPTDVAKREAADVRIEESVPLSHTLSHTLTFSHSYTLTHTLSHSLYDTHSLTHSHTLSHSLSHTFSHTRPHRRVRIPPAAARKGYNSHVIHLKMARDKSGFRTRSRPDISQELK